jgi:hypothetical protein
LVVRAPPSTAASHTSETNGTPLDLPYVDERPESFRDGQSPMSPGDNDGDMSEGDDDSDLFEDENNGNPLPLELYPGSPGGKALLAAIYPYIRAAAKKEKPSSLCGSLWGYSAFYESDRFDQEMLHDTVRKTGLPFAEVVYPAWVVHHSLGDGPAELLRQLLALKLYAKRPGYTWEQYCDALEASRDDFEKARESLELTSPDRTPSLSPNITPRIREAGPVDRTASLYSGLEGSVEFEV